MAVTVFDVIKGSRCARKGMRAGDILLSVNGNEINDVLDYRFYTREEKLTLAFQNRKGAIKHCRIRGDEDPDALGLQFETYLMDRHRSCKNKCIFCFIDQLPPGMRDSLYFKDDDSRLSFLFGNYITLTNLTEHDVERIISMHISPINASVHTMDPELRVQMMKNPAAGTSLSLLRRFSDAGIAINAQLVLCPGVNDGEALSFSLSQLALLEGVQSIAAVPVGITRYRDGLCPLRPFTSAEAAAVIDRIDAFNAQRITEGKGSLAYPSDEFFQICGRELPGPAYYGDYPQLENGVGMLTLTRDVFTDALTDAVPDSEKRVFSLATGRAAAALMRSLAQAFCEKYPGAKITVYEIENRFFGEHVTVAGLLTGRDVIDGLLAQGFSGGLLLLPDVMFKSRQERIFLDDVTEEDAARALNAEIRIVDCSGEGLFDVFFESVTS
ncbi:MAG: DUF512 domain-containing protein [Clostridia bacterium]|nr:DUF512 domain-containing protein [Clostridia bacterium]